VPGSIPAHHNLGTALHQLGDLPGAMVCFRKVLELDPKNAKAHTSLGNAL
jgi:Flp pilus assembly protein TadD